MNKQKKYKIVKSIWCIIVIIFAVFVGLIIWSMWGLIAGIVGAIISIFIIALIFSEIDRVIFGREFVEQMENIRVKEEKKDVEGLIKILQYDNDWSVKGDAAQALGEIGDEKAVESLIQVLFTLAPPVNTVTEAKNVVDAQDKIGDALVTIGAPAVNPLIHVLKESRSDEYYIQKKATEVLQRIGVDLNSI